MKSNTQKQTEYAARKKDKGMVRRSYYLNTSCLEVIETVKRKNLFKTNDEAVSYIINEHLLDAHTQN